MNKQRLNETTQTLSRVLPVVAALLLKQVDAFDTVSKIARLGGAQIGIDDFPSEKRMTPFSTSSGIEPFSERISRSLMPGAFKVDPNPDNLINPVRKDFDLLCELCVLCER